MLLDLVPAHRHQSDLFAPDEHRRQKLSSLIDRYGCCAIGFGLFPPGVRAFKGHAAFHRVASAGGNFPSNLTVQVQSELDVPEPASLALLSVAIAGFGGLSMVRRRRREY